ncbi:hypothetical protein DVT68_11020 [Dyella solisilvae]|uniref:Uncharacterized protein n=1 Tax=Dyella solisilvae TaxID=1920168 RepID=A0A370K8P7_9GAMM|nr:hypothetical protein [Dyella solisilvae]RDI99015.1 hypothetical protein DVT68_11020 [Dyella solisilvae]
MTLAAQVYAADPAAPGVGGAPVEATGAMAFQVNDDSTTLAVAKVPQIYLYGPIDADAANRFDALLKSGKIRRGSDIYLNSPGGDMAAGLALGRLFRSYSLGTHLGVPRRTSRMPAMPRAAQCANACAYAYLGGLYRWAPSGNDRLGVPPHDAAAATGPGSVTPTELTSYLKDMDIRADLLAPPPTAPGEEVAWLDSERVLATGLANNGYLATTATYRPMAAETSLLLSQMSRDGEHRITLLCRPEGMTLTAQYVIGTERSRKIAARVTRSYFEIDQQPTPQQETGNVSMVDQSLVFSHPVPVDELNRLLSARTMGAWLADRGGAVRYGFLLSLAGVQNHLREYSASCQQIAKAGAGASTAAAQAPRH